MKKHLMAILGSLVVSVAGISALAAPKASFDGKNLLSGEDVSITTKKEGTVVVFLSATCPCSNSHVEELKNLALEYPEFAFVAVHSNVDEPLEESQVYFKKAALPFPVLQDKDANLANEFKALKTPHSFVLSPDGKMLYQGGVSSSRELKKADRKYLREALADIKAHRPVKTPEGRTLGCAISRGEKNVW